MASQYKKNGGLSVITPIGLLRGLVRSRRVKRLTTRFRSGVGAVITQVTSARSAVGLTAKRARGILPPLIVEYLLVVLLLIFLLSRL